MEKKDKKDKLNWEKFAAHYSVHGNATRAYLSVFTRVEYSTARNEGAKYMANPCIIEIIEKFKEEFRERYMHNKEEKIQELQNSAEEAKALGQFAAYAKIQDMIIKMLDLNPQNKLDITSAGKQININLNLDD